MIEERHSSVITQSKSYDQLVPLSEQIMQILVERITNYSYPPGSRIDIEALKKEYKVSHIPIRDALHKLSEQGLVTIIPRVGYFTVKFTRAEVEDLFDIRILLELSAISKGLKSIDKEMLRSFKDKLTAMKKDLNTKSKEENAFFELNEFLHREIIIKNAHSNLTEKIYSSLLSKIKLASRIVYLPDDDIEEHLQIVKALLAEDKAKAKRLLKSHLISVKKRCVSKLNTISKSD